MPYRLVPEPAPHKDMIDSLQSLIDGVKSGAITGIAFACTLRRNRYITDVVGYCATHPTFTRGIVMSLSDELGARMHHSDPDETR